MINAMLTSIQIGLPRMRESAVGPWRTAYGKKPVWEPIWLTTTGLEGDGVGDTEHHGGPENAVCAYPGDHIATWRTELPHLPLAEGAFGENFTIVGVTEETVCVGDIFEVGDAIVQVSKPREPCASIAKWWSQPDFVKLVHQSKRTGWYMRVLREGHVEARSPMKLTERPHPEWPVARVFELWSNRKNDPEAAQSLLDCEALSAGWRAKLRDD